jgi:hypothetical protein
MVSDLQRSLSSGTGAALLLLSLLASTQDAYACTADKDCKGDRICERGACEDPSAADADSTPQSSVADAAFARIRAACTAGAIARDANGNAHPHLSRHTAARSRKTP